MKKYLAVGVALFLTACSSIPVQEHNGQLDTNYDFGKKENSKSIKIAIVSPAGSVTKFEKTVNINPLLGAIANQQKSKNKTDLVHEKYLTEVKTAFRNGFETLVTTRGFTYSGPYSSFDEITYSDKKKSYLALIPNFDIKIGKSDVHRENFSSYSEETGNIKIDGEFTLKMIEPLTKQVISQKRVDLTKLNITEPYIIQWEPKAKSNGLVGLVIDSAIKEATKPEELQVTYDKAFADAMTKFYQGTMQQLDKYVSSEEIVDFQADITELKTIKRF